MQFIAESYGGQLLPGQMYELPRLRFDHQGTPVIVEPEFYSQLPSDPGYHVTAVCPWPDATLRMELYPEGLLASLRKLVGMRDIEVGEAKFNRTYMITGNDVAKVRELMSPEFRDIVVQIHGKQWKGDIYLRILGGKFSITKQNLSGDEDTIRNFIQQSLGLFDVALVQPRIRNGESK